MKQRAHASRQTTLDLLEEAVHLLRTAPASALGWYYAGALPFVLTLLYFWTDMSWSADARRDCAVNAIGVAIAFVWMKFCQAMCAQRLRAQLRLESVSRMQWGGMLRMGLQQIALQPSKLFVLPVALVMTFPFAWVCAFYENATVFGEAGNLGSLMAKSWAQARLWPRQNHLALTLLLLFCFVMSLNILLITLIAPHFVKIFTGLENVFTRSGLHLFNTTILAVVASATYLCCDPLLKAVYVLRCFYGESLQSGEDLQVELRRVRQAPAALLSLLLLVVAFAAPIAAAEIKDRPPTAAQVEELDRSIGETIAQPEFRWRMPREETDAKNDSKVGNAVERFFRNLFRTLGKWWRVLWKWLDRLFGQDSMPEQKADSGISGNWTRGVLKLCLILLSAVLLVFLAAKIRDRYRQSRGARARSPSIKKVDLAEETVTADQLPEDEWLQLAAEMMARGEWRLALRAFFLASLVHLSKREMIALARHKSNRDYLIELRRRAAAHPALQDAFTLNLQAIERAWYGRHRVSEDVLESFRANLETIRTA